MLNIRLIIVFILCSLSIFAQEKIEALSPASSIEIPCNCMGPCYLKHPKEAPYLFDSCGVGQSFEVAQACAEAKMYQFILEHIEYPQTAIDSGIDGNVYIQFGIDAAGKIDNSTVEVVRKVHQSLDDEALRIVKMLIRKKWVPAKGYDHCPKTNNDAVNAYYIVPFRFKLRD